MGKDTTKFIETIQNGRMIFDYYENGLYGIVVAKLKFTDESESVYGEVMKRIPEKYRPIASAAIGISEADIYDLFGKSFIGKATCEVEDLYDYEIGRKIAENKAVKSFYQEVLRISVNALITLNEAEESMLDAILVPQKKIANIGDFLEQYGVRR